MNRRIELRGFLPWQVEVLRSDARYKVLSCGRRAGKTRLMAAAGFATAARGGRCWIVAPVLAQARETFNTIRTAGWDLPFMKVRDSDLSIRFSNGGIIEAKSSEDPKRLRGAGLDLVLLDEITAGIPEDVWTTVVRPALMDRHGRAYFASTPRGLDWFHSSFQRGLAGGEWRSWSFPTSANPNIAQDEIENARAELPERIFNEEWLGMFLADTSGVFRNIAELSTAQLEERRPGVTYAGFVDLAESRDFNAISVFRAEGQRGAVEVYADRWNRTPWEVSRQRIAAAMVKYPGSWSVDASGQLYNERFLDDLKQSSGLREIGAVKFTNEKKNAFVHELIAATEQREVRFLAPDTCEAARAQLHELLSFAGDRGPTGLMRYGAPRGNDDMVTACMVAHAQLKEHRKTAEGLAQAQQFFRNFTRW